MVAKRQTNVQSHNVNPSPVSHEQMVEWGLTTIAMNAIVYNTVNNVTKTVRKHRCSLSVAGAPEISYKNLPLLKSHMSECGKISSSRSSYNSKSKQRKVANAIKIARYLSLLPYVDY